jgi:uncharacterized protein (TIGR03000 family)
MREDYLIYYPSFPVQGKSFTMPASVKPPAPNTYVVLRVDVPEEDAEVWVEGVRMRQQGIVRKFKSPLIVPGKKYTYTIRARWQTEDGKVKDETRTIRVRGGDQPIVDFTVPLEGPGPAESPPKKD